MSVDCQALPYFFPHSLMNSKTFGKKLLIIHSLFAGLLARSQYPEGPATGHLSTGFSWFPCVYKRMLRWFPTLQVATTGYSYSHPELNFLDPYFIFMCMHYNHCHRSGTVVKVLCYKSLGRWFDSRWCHWHNPPDRTMALGSTHPLREMSTRSISWG